ASREFARSAAHTLMIGQGPRYVMECIAIVGLVAVALLSASGEAGAVPSLGQLTFLGFAAYRLLPTLQQAFAAIVRIRADQPGFTSIARDLRLARAASRAVAVEPAWRAAPSVQIRLTEVTYHHDPEGPAAINNVSLQIPARAAIGLVGAN